MGMSAYAEASANQPSRGVDADSVERLREAMGGQIQPLAVTPTQWFQVDLQEAQRLADQGQMWKVGQLWRSMHRDGEIQGLTATRTAGLVALPKRWRGDAKVIDALQSESGTRSVFDEMFPPSELALLAADGLGVGVGVAEMVPVVGRSHPVMVRLDPQFLTYRWSEACWYFQSATGLIRVEPGLGRWILHTPGGTLTPWQSGLWPSLGRAFIDKEHAMLHRSNFSGKLANPARVAYSTLGATEDQQDGMLRSLIMWGLNTCFQLPAGWEVKLLESNGRGWEVFQEQIDGANLEIMIALAGQVVTVTGGTGFANADIHATIRSDLIKQTGDALAHTINTQGIPPWVFSEFGPDALDESPRVAWDTDPPADRQTEATAMSAVAKAIDDLSTVLAKLGLALDVEEVIRRFGVPISDKPEDKARVTEMQAQAQAAADAANAPPGGDGKSGAPPAAGTKPKPKGQAWTSKPREPRNKSDKGDDK